MCNYDEWKSTLIPSILINYDHSDYDCYYVPVLIIGLPVLHSTQDHNQPMETGRC